jgi:hypothetical protein
MLVKIAVDPKASNALQTPTAAGPAVIGAGFSYAEAPTPNTT